MLEVSKVNSRVKPSTWLIGRKTKEALYAGGFRRNSGFSQSVYKLGVKGIIRIYRRSYS
jgi:hypothetical protein